MTRWILFNVTCCVNNNSDKLSLSFWVFENIITHLTTTQNKGIKKSEKGEKEGFKLQTLPNWFQLLFCFVFGFFCKCKTTQTLCLYKFVWIEPNLTSSTNFFSFNHESGDSITSPQQLYPADHTLTPLFEMQERSFKKEAWLYHQWLVGVGGGT